MVTISCTDIGNLNRELPRSKLATETYMIPRPTLYRITRSKVKPCPGIALVKRNAPRHAQTQTSFNRTFLSRSQGPAVSSCISSASRRRVTITQRCQGNCGKFHSGITNPGSRVSRRGHLSTYLPNGRSIRSREASYYKTGRAS